MAGYSGTPLAQKLGIKPGYSVLLFKAPQDFEGELVGLPPDARITRDAATGAPFYVAVCFFTSRASLQAEFIRLSRAIVPDGGLWVAWPKKASGVATDLTEDVLRELGLPTGMVDNKVCAVNETWSGLRFVWRLENRPGATTSKRRPGH